MDVGSRVDFAGQLTSVTKVAFVDIRPLEVELEDFESIGGSILDLPFEGQSLESVSCLHVAAHRPGPLRRPARPARHAQAALELQRVLAPGGQLLFAARKTSSRRSRFAADWGRTTRGA